MRVTVLSDNIEGKTLRGEWGLSHYIEYGDKVVLLDAGVSDLYAENARLLGIDLETVDYAVLSHAHDDHANGFESFFDINSHAPLFVAEKCSDNCYDIKDEGLVYAGIPRGMLERHADRVIRASGDMMIDNGIRLLGHTTAGLGQLGLAESMYARHHLRAKAVHRQRL